MIESLRCFICGIDCIFWAYSSKEFVDIPLFLLKSDWRAVCS